MYAVKGEYFTKARRGNQWFNLDPRKPASIEVLDLKGPRRGKLTISGIFTYLRGSRRSFGKMKEFPSHCLKDRCQPHSCCCGNQDRLQADATCTPTRPARSRTVPSTPSWLTAGLAIRCALANEIWVVTSEGKLAVYVSLFPQAGDQPCPNRGCCQSEP